MPIDLLVASQTASIVWGQVPPEPAVCSSVLSAVDLAVVVGFNSVAIFTACDDEGLPVSHGLPKGRFTALLGNVGSSPSITYRGQGEYEVTVQLNVHGTGALHINLDGAAAAEPLPFVSTCPSGRISLEAGECGCPQGLELVDGACSPCATVSQCHPHAADLRPMKFLLTPMKLLFTPATVPHSPDLASSCCCAAGVSKGGRRQRGMLAVHSWLVFVRPGSIRVHAMRGWPLSVESWCIRLRAVRSRFVCTSQWSSQVHTMRSRFICVSSGITHVHAVLFWRVPAEYRCRNVRAVRSWHLLHAGFK